MDSSDNSISVQDRMALHGKDTMSADQADNGLQALRMAEEKGLHLDAAANRRLRRRADMVIMPCLCLVFSVSHLDRFDLSFGSALGLVRDLKLVGQDYSWIGSVFFFGYLGIEFLTGRLLQRLPIGKYLGLCTMLWGVVSCCFAVAHNYGDAIAIRFTLGMLQACVWPALILIVSQWYTRPEQCLRTAIFISSAGFAQIVGGFMAYGIAKGSLQHQYSIAGWKVLFLAFGSITVFFGALVFVLVPANQLSAWWLSPDDRVLAVQRVSVNQQGIGNRKFKWYQIREALTDPVVWALTFFGVAVNIPGGGLTTFFSQIIISFGFTPEQSLLYYCPAGAVTMVAPLVWGVIAQRSGHRILLGMVAIAIGTVGAILIVALPQRLPVGRLIGYYLTGAYQTGEVVMVSLISSNVAGYTKKTTVSAMFLIAYCVGNILGPQIFRAKDAPRYVSAEITIVVLLAACMVDMLFLLSFLAWRNRQKEKRRQREGYVKQQGVEFWDLTDKENSEFVYAT